MAQWQMNDNQSNFTSSPQPMMTGEGPYIVWSPNGALSGIPAPPAVALQFAHGNAEGNQTMPVLPGHAQGWQTVLPGSHNPVQAPVGAFVLVPVPMPEGPWAPTSSPGNMHFSNNVQGTWPGQTPGMVVTPGSMVQPSTMPAPIGNQSQGMQALGGGSGLPLFAVLPDANQWQPSIVIDGMEEIVPMGAAGGESGYPMALNDQVDPECDNAWYEPKDCASSEASTAVSRSARRRRGRRAVKEREMEGTAMELRRPLQMMHNRNETLAVSKEKRQELLQELDSDTKTRSRIIASLLPEVQKMAFELHGCWVVQKALEVGDSVERDHLVGEFRGHVPAMIASPNANFVLAKIVEVVPIASADFVAQELANFASDAARHRYGCRILCRLVEHHLSSTAQTNATSLLIAELLVEADQLINHNFARHVMEMVLEHGSPDQKHSIALAILKNVLQTSKNRHGSYVVEKAMQFCSAADQQAMAGELVSNAENFLMLATHECGSHVVEAIVKSHTPSAADARAILLRQVDMVSASKYGQQMLQNTRLAPRE